MITILLSIAIVGFLCWCVLQIPMPAPFRNILLGVMVLCLVIYLLNGFGITDFGTHWRR
jgi:hypothetical protein